VHPNIHKGETRRNSSILQQARGGKSKNLPGDRSRWWKRKGDQKNTILPAIENKSPPAMINTEIRPSPPAGDGD